MNMEVPSRHNVRDASEEFWQSIQTMMQLQTQAPPLQPLCCDEKLSLSFPEERLWLLNQLQPNNVAQNLPFAFQLTGVLHREALERSFLELMQRHESLRSRFVDLEGQPVRMLATTLESLDFHITDLRTLPDVEREQEAQRLMQQVIDRPFDLKAGQLLRVHLLQLQDQEHLLLLVVHHIVFDGWSEGVLFQELAKLYEVFSTGQSASLPDLPIQYGDFAAWQRQYLQGEMQHILLSYWQRQLGDGLPVQLLPAARRHPVGSTRRSARQTFRLSSELTQALKQLSRRERTTLFVSLLAAFKLVLHRYTGQSDLFVCTPTANRTRHELKGLIGYFINLLILRTDVSGDPSFQELMGRIRQVVSGANAHQDLPFQQVLEQLQLGSVPLTQILFVLQNYPQQLLQLAEVQVERLEIDSSTADFDLFLSLTEEAGQLQGEIKYNTDRFEDWAIAQLLTDYQGVLEGVVAAPELPISSPLFLAEDRRVDPEGDATDASERVYVAPRNLAEQQLAEIWQQVLNIERISVQDNFFELGGHSLLALRLFDQIEQKLGKKLPLSTLYQAPTLEQLATTLQQEETATFWSSLVAIQPNGSKPPLFCVHGLGGNVLCFRDLADHLGLNQPLYGLQARGLDGKQPPLGRVEEMAAYYLKEIRELQPEGPYFLSGLSFGGMVAFEMAQQLHAQDQTVALLALFDTYGPDFYKPLPFSQWLLRHSKNLLRLRLRDKLTYLCQALEAVTTRLQKMTRKLYSKLNHSSSSIRQNTPLDQVISISGIAARNYQPQPYPFPMILFRACEQTWWSSGEPRLGWSELVASKLEIYEVPGNHFSIEKQPVLAEQLKICLERACLQQPISK